VAYFWATSFGKNLSAAAAINPCLGCSVRFLRLPPLQKLGPMSDDEFAAIIGIVEQQPIQAQACLDLFEKDHGRRAYTTSEVRNWADGQDPESLRFRILRRVHSDHGWKKACKRIWNDIPTSFDFAAANGTAHLSHARGSRKSDRPERGRGPRRNRAGADRWHEGHARHLARRPRHALPRIPICASLRGQVGCGQIGFWQRPTTRCGYAGARGGNVDPRQAGRR